MAGTGPALLMLAEALTERPTMERMVPIKPSVEPLATIPPS